ncbi:MAG: hypothetical protein ACP5FL_08140, partial [Thermoplasmatota archaeon]
PQKSEDSPAFIYSLSEILILPKDLYIHFSIYCSEAKHEPKSNKKEYENAGSFGHSFYYDWDTSKQLCRFGR